MKPFGTHPLAGLAFVLLTFPHTVLAQGPTPCNLFTWIQCGDVLLNETTLGAGNEYNTVNSYKCMDTAMHGYANGPDRLYKIHITEPTTMRFVLDILNGADLDMVLADTCGFIANCSYTAEYNPANGIYREVLDVYRLVPGTYYLLVDGKDVFGYGDYNLTVDCSCSCSEPGSDAPIGRPIFCDDFENYLPNELLSPQSSRWVKWDSTSVDALVSPNGFTGQAGRLQTIGNNQPRVVYRFEDKEPPAGAGRFRVSWKMNVAPGKTARYNLLHRGPQTGFVNWGYHVFFKANNTGEVRLGNPANAPIATFPYPSNVWMNVVQIIDMTNNRAELWINNNFITAWVFSTGYTQAGVNYNLENRMNAIEFVADNNTDFRIDNICVWEKTGNCAGGFGPVCVENGVTYATSDAARCDLYTSLEWGNCNNLCDFGGTFIYRGDQYTGVLDSSNFAPDLIRNDACVVAAYGGNVPSPLYSNVYIFSKNDTDILDILFNAQNNQAQAKTFVFACNTVGPTGACVVGQQCLQEVGGSGIYTPLTCDSFYYIVITGTVGTDYTLSIVPSGPCNSNFTNLNLDCLNVGGATITTDQLDAFSVFDTSATDSPYRQCYGGPRPYTGGEKIYKISLLRPSIVSLLLTAQAPMGIFLSSYECGRECLNYAEVDYPTDSTAFLSELLPEGNYFIIIDKATPAGSDDFTLTAFCEPRPYFITFGPSCLFPKPDYSPIDPQKAFQANAAGETSCSCVAPDLGAGSHTVLLRNGLYSFSENDAISFFFRDSIGTLSSNETSYTFFYQPSPTGHTFTLDKNNPVEPIQCFYNNTDSMHVWLIQTSPGSRNFREILITYADTMPPGITATNLFEGGANSEIANVTISQPVTFGGSTLRVRTRSTAETRRISFLSSLPWHTELVGPDTSWLSVSLPSGGGGGAYPIDISLTANPSPLPRAAILRFVPEVRPDFYRYEVLIEQDGVCIPAAVVIEADVTEFCEGDSITLTANVGVNPADSSQSLESLYNFRWNDDSNTPSIALLPSVGPKIYSVTITNKDFNCPTTAADTFEFTVNPRPQPPVAVGPTSYRICAGDLAPVLMAQVPPGQEVYWYDQPEGGQPLSPIPSPTYMASDTVSASYYAEARFIGGCPSLTRRAFLVIVDSLPTLVLSTAECDSTHLTYHFTATTSGNALTVSAGQQSLTNGVYTIFNVPIGSSVLVTAFNPFCDSAVLVLPPQCVCTVSVPASGGDQTICSIQPIPQLTATVAGSNETVDWYAAPTGGTVLPGGQGTTTYQPASAGAYFAEGRNTLNGCTSDARTEVRLTVHPTPALVLTDTVCAPNLSTYQLSIQTAPDAVLSIAPQNIGIVSGANGAFMVSQIPEGQDIALTVTDPATGCSSTQVVVAPDCACLTVEAPVSGGDVLLCPGEPFPPLSVTVAPGLSANWFNVNQVLVASNTLSFTPIAPGTYFAQAINPLDSCTSFDQTPVALTVYSPPLLTVGAPQCAPNRQSYSVTVTTGANSMLNASAGMLAGANGAFTVADIPVGTPVALTVTDAGTGCTNETVVLSPDCPCVQVISAPVAPGNGTVQQCADQPIPVLVVSVGVDQTADWYNALGGVLALGTTQYLPSGAGTFFVKARDTVSNCVSDAQTAVSLVIHPLPTMQVVSKNCDSTLQTYTVQLSTQADVQITPNAGNVSGANGQYTISSIAAGATVAVTALALQTGCSAVLLITAPVCTCDSTIAAPVSNGDQSVCVGQAFPALSVAVGVGQTAVWYNASGVEVGQGLTYVPTAPGTYFAETRNLIDDCPSLTRTPVALVVNPLPILVIADTLCAENLATYSLEVLTDGTSIAVVPTFLTIPTGPAAFAILNIPVGTSVSITAEQANTGCSATQTISVNTCPCPSIAAPISGGDKEVCQGGPLPVLSVTVPNPSQQTTDWFLAPSGGLPILNGGIGTLNFQPTLSETRTYYAQARDTETNCISTARTPVALTVYLPATVSAGPDQAACAGAQVPLSATLNGVTDGSWNANITGGLFFPNNTALSAAYYLPPPGATGATLTLTSTDPPGPCPAVSDVFVVAILPLPTLVLDTTYCAPNLQTYAVELVSNGLSVIPNAGTVTPLGNNRYRVSGIAKGVPLSVTVLNSSCSVQADFPALDCACPAVAPPLVPALVSACANEPLPMIVAQAGPDETVDWYSAATGGVALQLGSFQFQPAFVGTFYAQTRNTVHGCTSDRVPVQVVSRPLPQANAGLDQTVCPGTSATFTAASGAGYTYLWNTGETTQTITVTPAAVMTYFLTVTVDGCSATDSVQVQVSPAVASVVELVSPVRCFGDANGAIRANVSGGTPGFSYAWSNGSVLATINGLPTGTYTVTVTDNATCQTTATYLLSQPNVLTIANTNTIQPAPGVSNGSLEISIVGGTMPYTYQWYRNDTLLLDETGALLDSISEGVYAVVVTDSLGCTTTSGPLPLMAVGTGSDPTWSNLIAVYPNPTTGQLYIRLTLPDWSEVESRVLDAMGREVLRTRHGNQREGLLTLHLTGQASGLYVVQVRMNRDIATFKINLTKY